MKDLCKCLTSKGTTDIVLELCYDVISLIYDLQFIIVPKFATGRYHSTRCRNPWLNLIRSNSEFQPNTFQYFYISVAHKYY